MNRQTDRDNWWKWGLHVGWESKKKKKDEKNCLWRLSVRLSVLSWFRLFLLDIPAWTHLPPSVWLKLGQVCHVLSWACWGKLGRLQTCK